MSVCELDRWINGNKDRKPRPRLTIEARKVKLSFQGNKCGICGKPYVGGGLAGFQTAHIKAHSRGGYDTMMLCCCCHDRYDAGECSAKEVSHLNLTLEDYIRCVPSERAKQNIRNKLLIKKVAVLNTEKFSNTNSPKKSPKKLVKKNKRSGYWAGILW